MAQEGETPRGLLKPLSCQQGSVVSSYQDSALAKTDMDELLKGLSLLGPKLEQLTRQVDLLTVQSVEFQTALVGKADLAEFGRLKEQVSFMSSELLQKNQQLEAERTELLGQMTEQVRDLSGALARKAEATRLTEVEGQLQHLSATVDGKVDAPTFEKLQEQVTSLSSTTSEKTDKAVFDSLQQEVRALRQKLDEGVDKSELARMNESLQNVLSSKADTKLIDQLLEKERALNTSLTQKAEFTELEQLKIQLHALNGLVNQKAEAHNQELQQVSVKLQAMTTTVEGCAGAEETKEKLEALSTSIDSKADLSKVDSVITQLQLMSDLLGPRLKRVGSPRPQSTKGGRKLVATGQTL